MPPYQKWSLIVAKTRNFNCPSCGGMALPGQGQNGSGNVITCLDCHFQWYENVCWSCHHRISSLIHDQCGHGDCTWYVCSHCGACSRGCPKTKERQASGEYPKKLTPKRLRSLPSRSKRCSVVRNIAYVPSDDELEQQEKLGVLKGVYRDDIDFCNDVLRQEAEQHGWVE